MKRVLRDGLPFAEPLPEGFLYHGASVFTTCGWRGGNPFGWRRTFAASAATPWPWGFPTLGTRPSPGT